MAEKIISAGVFTNEIDQTFLPAGVGAIGAALIGPTVKGPAGIPTMVSSYGEYQQIFGDTFTSGSSTVSHLTAHTAREYLKHGSTLTVVRILDGGGPAYSVVPTGSFDGTYFTGSNKITGSVEANASFKLYTLSDGSILNNVTRTAIISGASTASNATLATNGYDGFDILGGAEKTITGSLKNNALVSGSRDNIRWQTSNINPKKGTFTLSLRSGDDTHKRKKIIETWPNVSLDPNTSNYIAKVIGDQKFTLQGVGSSDPYLQLSGSFPNKSKYVRVDVSKPTINYLDTNGDITSANSGSAFNFIGYANLPGENSGGFVGGSDGKVGFDALGNSTGTNNGASHAGGYGYYENIADLNSQGFLLTTDSGPWEDAINLLSNQDEYDINLLMMPGVTDAGTGGSALIGKAIDMCENRGDCFVIADPTNYESSLGSATDEAEARDSNYAAMYYPWVQIGDPDTGLNRWVPPSVVMGGIYAFNDKVAHPWFAPAGLNRGGVDSAIQVERKLTHANRDTLYDSNVNPIATFPAQGVVVWGQKTLQKKASALDRVNVRRLLIKVKKFIASSSRFLVFEQNNASTRRRFLNIVNPYMEQVQSNSGLNAFRVVMDESNNTPDTIDRNYLVGQIFLQPTRTAEFIVLDFTVQPTGATFPE
jgi:hypothetical protein